MTQPRKTTTRCATCAYRQPAGLITITDAAGTRTAPACLTCAVDALQYYGAQRTRIASFTTLPNPNDR
jgi:hypothetical protein